jgi:hypothetical protein
MGLAPAAADSDFAVGGGGLLAGFSVEGGAGCAADFVSEETCVLADCSETLGAGEGSVEGFDAEDISA